VKASPLFIGEYRGQRGQRGRSLAATRRKRPSWRRLILRLGAAVLLVGLLGYGGFWLLTSPSFAVARVQSGRYRFSAQEEVEAALSSCLGKNIWTLTRGDVEEAVAGLAWVRSLSLSRQIPDQLTVEFVEWRPLLAVAGDDQGGPERLLVEDGRVLDLPGHLVGPGLPVLVGCRLEADGEGIWRLGETDADTVLDLLAALEASGLEGTVPVDFVSRTEQGFVLVLQDHAGSLLLGNEDFATRLGRYLLARDRIPAGSAVDLRFADRITYESS